MPTAAVVLTGQARSPGAARRFCSEALLGWGAGQHEESARLLVSELVTNAVLHARTDITLRLELDATVLRLEVSDGSARQPVTRHYSREATTGRGLALIDALAGRWGVEFHGTGKTVWAELAGEAPGRRVPDGEVDLSAFPDLEPLGPAPGSETAGEAGPAVLDMAA